MLVHVDDFLCTGCEDDLIWLREAMSNRFDIKSQLIGTRSEPYGELTFLGRSILMTRRGIEIEGDEKHLKGLLTEWKMESEKGVETPEVKEDTDEAKLEMGSLEATRYRRAAARINYMALERPDLGHASKEISKCMAMIRNGEDSSNIIKYLLLVMNIGMGRREEGSIRSIYMFSKCLSIRHKRFKNQIAGN